MRITIQNITSLKINNTLNILIEKKLGKLKTFYADIQNVDVSLIEEGHINNKGIEVKLHMPGHTLFAKELTHSFEHAIDKVVESLRRQLRKIKGKKRNFQNQK